MLTQIDNLNIITAELDNLNTVIKAKHLSTIRTSTADECKAQADNLYEIYVGACDELDRLEKSKARGRAVLMHQRDAAMLFALYTAYDLAGKVKDGYQLDGRDQRTLNLLVRAFAALNEQWLNA